MRALHLLLFALVLGCSTTEGYSIDIPKEWQSFAKERGLKLKFAYAQTPSVESWNVKCKPITKETMPLAKKYWRFFSSEFSKYPVPFLKKVGLKEITFVSDLTVSGARVMAMPDYINDRLVLDVRMYDLEWYSRHVVHHEFYHLVEEEIFGDSYYKDPEWAKFNTAGFKYGSGGATAQDPSYTPLTHPAPGFINGYSQSGLEEDKAEMWTVIMFEDDWKTVSPWFADDPILKLKADYLQKVGETLCPKMNTDFWSKLHK